MTYSDALNHSMERKHRDPVEETTWKDEILGFWSAKIEKKMRYKLLIL